LPGAEIHFITAERASGTPNPFGPHVAFEIEDFDSAKRELEAKGVRFVESPDMIDVRQLWLLDPSGNTIELWTRKTPD
jgi:catechol 2,3-dioxygenase-like lactoylglutathione lyase family enzyme